MLTHVEFRSDRFPADPDEEQLINPELWGRRLATFLRDGLIAKGFQIGEPLPEDWGWRLRVENQPFRVWIGCGHYQEYEDGFLCFIEPHKPSVWRWFRPVNTERVITSLRMAIDAVLAPEEGVHDKKWWTYEQFNCIPTD